MSDDKRSQGLLEAILRELIFIHDIINRPTKAKIIFRKGDTMSAAAVTLNIGQVVPASPVETNADGSNFAFNPANIEWSVQNPAICSQGPNNPDGSVDFTALTAGVTQVGFSDSATGLSAQGTITVNPAVTGPTSASIVFGTPTTPVTPAAAQVKKA